jgi:plastocyanin
VLVGVVGLLFALPASTAGGDAQQPSADVKAEGNAFTGGLKFDPPKVRVKVGQVVRWTNTDDFVPHTATEDHSLWDLTGTYGETPANPPGFGPGETRQRAFEAGTQHYYCKVHPNQMSGVVAVPVTLAVKKGPTKNGHKTRRLILTWASAAPAGGEVFDVQVMRAGGKWKNFRTGTRKRSGKRGTQGKKVAWSVRARLRRADDKQRATGWSPVASIMG